MAVWALIGFMGCGKSSIGRTVQRLAAKAASGVIPVFAKKRLSQKSSGPLQFIDLDEEIVRREGRSVPEIFADGGEAAFRTIERATLAELLSEANSLRGNASLPTVNLLLSLGGGTLTDPESRKLVQKNCKCIYLRASVKTLVANLREVGTEGRPMLAGANPNAPADSPESLESRIASMMAARGPIYESAADIILDIDGMDYSDIARQIINSFSL